VPARGRRDALLRIDPVRGAEHRPDHPGPGAGHLRRPLDLPATRGYRASVQKNHFPFILAAILAFGFIAGRILGLILAAIGLLIAYFLSLRVHPRMRHGSCNGTGEHRGAVFTWVHRKCPGCQGGRIVRWGAGRWGAEHIRTEASRGREARAAAREANRWR